MEFSSPRDLQQQLDQASVRAWVKINERASEARRLLAIFVLTAPSESPEPNSRPRRKPANKLAKPRKTMDIEQLDTQSRVAHETQIAEQFMAQLREQDHRGALATSRRASKRTQLLLHRILDPEIMYSATQYASNRRWVKAILTACLASDAYAHGLIATQFDSIKFRFAVALGENEQFEEAHKLMGRASVPRVHAKMLEAFNTVVSEFSVRETGSGQVSDAVEFTQFASNTRAQAAIRANMNPALSARVAKLIEDLQFARATSFARYASNPTEQQELYAQVNAGVEKQAQSHLHPYSMNFAPWWISHATTQEAQTQIAKRLGFPNFKPKRKRPLPSVEPSPALAEVRRFRGPGINRRSDRINTLIAEVPKHEGFLRSFPDELIDRVDGIIAKDALTWRSDAHQDVDQPDRPASTTGLIDSPEPNHRVIDGVIDSIIDAGSSLGRNIATEEATRLFIALEQARESLNRGLVMHFDGPSGRSRGL